MKFLFLILFFIFSFSTNASSYKLKGNAIICSDIENRERVILIHFDQVNYPFELNNAFLYLKKFWNRAKDDELADEIETPIIKYDFNYLYDADHIFFYDISEYDPEELDSLNDVQFYIQRSGLYFYDYRDIEGKCEALGIIQEKDILDIITKEMNKYYLDLEVPVTYPKDWSADF